MVAEPGPALLLCPKEGRGQLSYLWQLARGGPVAAGKGWDRSPVLTHGGNGHGHWARSWVLFSRLPQPTGAGQAENILYCIALFNILACRRKYVISYLPKGVQCFFPHCLLAEKLSTVSSFLS